VDGSPYSVCRILLDYFIVSLTPHHNSEVRSTSNIVLVLSIKTGIKTGPKFLKKNFPKVLTKDLRIEVSGQDALQSISAPNFSVQRQ
jgi:hypothetical protein